MAVAPMLTVEVLVVVFVATETAPGIVLVTVHVFCLVLAAKYGESVVSLNTRL